MSKGMCAVQQVHYSGFLMSQKLLLKARTEACGKFCSAISFEVARSGSCISLLTAIDKTWMLLSAFSECRHLHLP